MIDASELSAFETGCAFERQRIREIMELPEADGREGAALMLALRGDVPREMIRVLLAAITAGPRPTFQTRALMPRKLRLAFVNSKLGHHT